MVLNPRAITTVVLLLVVVGGAGWLWYQPEPAMPDGSESANISNQESESDRALDMALDVASPFAVQGGIAETDAQANTSAALTTQSESQNSITSDSQSASSSNSVLVDSSENFPPLDISAIGQSSINDADFEALVERLRADPQLLLQLIDEFRQETNPQRLAILSRLLGEVGGPDVTLSASELIFSGDAQSRALGLELLQQVQPGNSDARDIVSGLLATEVEPGVLVSTLTTLASPGNVDDVARANLSEQVAYLTEHDDASVRAISLNILSRWTTDSRYTSVLIGGLNDSIPTVRESAAYALVGHEDPSQDVLDSLFTVIDNNQENESVRRGAILALRGMALSDAQRTHIAKVERALDSRPR